MKSCLRTRAPVWDVARGLLVFLVCGILSFTIMAPPTSDSLLHGAGAIAGARDLLLWPFDRASIWNLPIGANAVYVPASIRQATQWGMTTDPDVLILTPNAPLTPVYFNSDGWSHRNRCRAEGGVLFSAPIPSDFVVPGAGPRNPDGTTPNYATAVLATDGMTLFQGQPFARCTAGGTATIWWFQKNERLDGMGNSGGHGGSMLSSIGGTIRLTELVLGGVIHHALKVNLFGAENYWYDSATQGYRWPATTADSGAARNYGGSVRALRMGSLLALPSSIDVNSMGLETDAAKILAHAFQDYGAYTVDDAAWSVYAIATEFSPRGKVEDNFVSSWGFSMRPQSRTVPWARDMDRIFGALNVVDNWNEAMWQTVSSSNGAQGAGGGSPRVSWAP